MKSLRRFVRACRVLQESPRTIFHWWLAGWIRMDEQLDERLDDVEEFRKQIRLLNKR